MDKNLKIILRRCAIDLILLASVSFPILCLNLWGKAFERGFFCDDESLRHPFHDSTIANYWLYVIALVFPTLVMVPTEFMRFKNSKSFKVGNRTIPYWIWAVYCTLQVYFFGASCSQLLTDLLKYSVGRLRPHFFDVCNPNIDCSNPLLKNTYIVDYKCQSDDAHKIKEIRLSFPSGHSSITMYAMVYIALYLQMRMNWKGSVLLRPFLQFVLLMFGVWTAMTRINNYKHHWSDVLTGLLLGILVAALIFFGVANMRRPRVQEDFLYGSTYGSTEEVPNGSSPPAEGMALKKKNLQNAA